jgi:hypothetical protein
VLSLLGSSYCAEILLKSLLEGCSTFRANCFNSRSRWNRVQIKRRLLVLTQLGLVLGVDNITLALEMAWTLIKVGERTKSLHQTIRVVMRTSWELKGLKKLDMLVDWAWTTLKLSLDT